MILSVPLSTLKFHTSSAQRPLPSTSTMTSGSSGSISIASNSGSGPLSIANSTQHQQQQQTQQAPPSDASFPTNVTSIQQLSVVWLHTLVPRLHWPTVAEYSCLVRKVLFLEPPTTYFGENPRLICYLFFLFFFFHFHFFH
jgi:hypothetical protein